MKFFIDKSAPGEKSACDTCEHYRTRRTMENETQHFCASEEIRGGAYDNKGPVRRMVYKASECSFYSKDKSGENFVIAEKNRAYHVQEALHPITGEALILCLNPKESGENGAFGPGLPREFWIRRGLVTEEEFAEIDKRRHIKAHEAKMKAQSAAQAAQEELGLGTPDWGWRGRLSDWLYDRFWTYQFFYDRLVPEEDEEVATGSANR